MFMNSMIAIKDLIIHKEFECTSADCDHLYMILKSMKNIIIINMNESSWKIYITFSKIWYNKNTLKILKYINNISHSKYSVFSHNHI